MPFWLMFPGGLPKTARKEKVTWEESTSPANFIPEGVPFMPACLFTDTFGKKEFEKTEAQKVFVSDRLPLLSRNLLSEEFSARQHLLGCSNVVVAVESLVLQLRG